MSKVTVPHVAAKTPQELYDLYRQDRLVLHTMPTNSIPERPQRIKDPSSLVCGSLLFFHGLVHSPTGVQLDNAVARFGEHTKVMDTVFGTLHDLEGVWATHRQLEARKPPHLRGEPFVYFTNCDMCDVAKASGGLPDDTYTKAQWQVTPPVQFQRAQGFDFRHHCEHSHVKDDATKPALHCEWNELRAALNAHNMVGLVYIHDPAHHPRQHLEAARELRSRFNCLLHELAAEPAGDVSCAEQQDTRQLDQGCQQETGQQDVGRQHSAVQQGVGAGQQIVGKQDAGERPALAPEGGAPQHAQQHQLQQAGEPHQQEQQWVMGVFVLEGEGHVSGKLLVEEHRVEEDHCHVEEAHSDNTGAGKGGAAKAARGAGWFGRLVTFEEYLQRLQQQQPHDG